MNVKDNKANKIKQNKPIHFDWSCFALANLLMHNSYVCGRYDLLSIVMKLPLAVSLE